MSNREMPYENLLFSDHAAGFPDPICAVSALTIGFVPSLAESRLDWHIVRGAILGPRMEITPRRGDTGMAERGLHQTDGSPAV
jgi:hypothetical protein